MGDFLNYGTPKGGETPPLVPDRDPRGKSSDEFRGLLIQEREEKEATEAYWATMAEENDFSKMQYLGKAVTEESLVSNLFGIAEDYVEDYDPTFDPTPFIKEDWPDWRKEAVLDAKNEKHAQILVERTHEQDLYNKEGEYHGGVGMALNLAGALINPENYVLGVGEVAALTKLGLTGAKRVAVGAALGATTNAAQEAVIIANNKSRDKLALLTAAGFGGAFGAVGGLVNPKSLDADKAINESVAKNISGAWKNDLDVATGDIKITKPFYRSPDAQLWNDAVKAGNAAVDVDGSYVVQMGNTALKYNDKAQALAAYKLRQRKVIKADEVPTEAQIKEQVSLDYEEMVERFDKTIPRRKGGRFNSIGLQGLSSKNPVTRFLHSLVVEDASGTGGKKVATHSAALRSDMYAMQMRSQWHTTRHALGKQYIKEQKLSNWKPWDNSAMDKFDDAVIAEVGYRRVPASRPKGEKVNQIVAQAADNYMGLQKMRFDMMKRAGVTGYDVEDLDNLYIKHKWDGVAMTQIMKKHDKQFVIDLLAEGIMRGGEFKRMRKYGKLGEKLTEEYKMRTARNMADAIYSRFTRRPDTVNMARAGWLTKADKQELTRRIEKFVTEEADIKHILASADGKDNRLLNDLLRQIDLDVNTTIDGVSIRDLMDTNLGASMDTDIRRTAGRTAMADVGFKDQEEFLEMTELAGRWSRENLNMDQKTLERTNENNQDLWRIVMGENLEKDANSTRANFARGIRKASTLASLNQVGFAQAAETGRLVGALGVKGMMKQIPAFGNMIRRMKNGTFKDPILNDIENAFGVKIGDNEILNHPMLLAESGGVTITKQESKGFLAGMDTAMNKGLHVQGWLNGMNAMMKIQHRMHARGFFMRMHEDLGKAKLSSARIKRYAEMGLDESDLKTLSNQFKKHTEMGEGWLGQQRPVNFNLAKFDPEIRNKVALAWHKNQANAIQRNLGGETAWWMENTTGKLFTQFRTFPLVAIEKQTLKDLKHLDAETFVTTMGSLGFAALAYTAKTYANSFGLPAKKRKQYLKNRMTPEKIFAGATAWSGQANIMPDLLRTSSDFVGWDNPWAYSAQKGQAYRDYYRERGLDLGAIGAAGSMADNAYKFVSGVGQAATTAADFRAETFKHAVRISPFGNNLAVKALSNHFLE